MQLEPYWVVSVWVPGRYQVAADRMEPATMSSGEILTVVGEITDVARDDDTVTLHLATDAGKTYVVDAGPPADLEAIAVQPGDHVAVRGNRPADRRQAEVDLVAHVISKDDQSVRVATARLASPARRHGK